MHSNKKGAKYKYLPSTCMGTRVCYCTPSGLQEPP